MGFAELGRASLVRILKSLAIVARAWRLWLLALALVAEVAGTAALTRPVPIPGRDISDVVFPLFPIVLAVTYTMCDEVLADATTEARHPRRRLRRLVLFLLAAGIGLLAALCAAAVSTASAAVLTRNTLVLLALVAVPGRRFATVSTTLATTYCAFSWIVGAQGVGVSPARWALLLQPSSGVGAAAVSSICLVAVVVAFTVQLPARA